MTKQEILNLIEATIKPNNKKAISAQSLQNVLTELENYIDLHSKFKKVDEIEAPDINLPEIDNSGGGSGSTGGSTSTEGNKIAYNVDFYFTLDPTLELATSYKSKNKRVLTINFLNPSLIRGYEVRDAHNSYDTGMSCMSMIQDEDDIELFYIFFSRGLEIYLIEARRDTGDAVGMLLGNIALTDMLSSGTYFVDLSGLSTFNDFVERLNLSIPEDNKIIKKQDLFSVIRGLNNPNEGFGYLISYSNNLILICYIDYDGQHHIIQVTSDDKISDQITYGAKCYIGTNLTSDMLNINKRMFPGVKDNSIKVYNESNKSFSPLSVEAVYNGYDLIAHKITVYNNGNFETWQINKEDGTVTLLTN